MRHVYIGEWLDVPVYEMDDLAPNHRIAGPAIVESRTTTILLRPGDHANVTATGWLDIEVGESASLTGQANLAAE